LTLLICGGCLIAPFYIRARALTGSELYEQALQEMNNSGELTGLLGNPIEGPSGWRFWRFEGNFNADGNATFPIRGPQGAGSAHLVAVPAQETWTLQELTVDVEGHDSVNVLP
jgi:hypothetical protein